MGVPKQILKSERRNSKKVENRRKTKGETDTSLIHTQY